MNPILAKLPIVKASEVQKNFKKVVKEVQKEGYRFVMNRGNVQIVMVSLPLYTSRIADTEEQENPYPIKVNKKDKKKIIYKAVGIWKNSGKTWQEILKEIREEDNKKPFDVYLKELMEWQKQFLS